MITNLILSLLFLQQGQTGLSIAQKLGYISVVETLKAVTDSPISPTPSEEKYKVVSPETMQETFMSDSEDEGGIIFKTINYNYIHTVHFISSVKLIL